MNELANTSATTKRTSIAARARVGIRSSRGASLAGSTITDATLRPRPRRGYYFASNDELRVVLPVFALCEAKELPAQCGVETVVDFVDTPVCALADRLVVVLPPALVVVVRLSVCPVRKFCDCVETCDSEPLVLKLPWVTLPDPVVAQFDSVPFFDDVSLPLVVSVLPFAVVCVSQVLLIVPPFNDAVPDVAIVRPPPVLVSEEKLCFTAPNDPNLTPQPLLVVMVVPPAPLLPMVVTFLPRKTRNLPIPIEPSRLFRDGPGDIVDDIDDDPREDDDIDDDPREGDDIDDDPLLLLPDPNQPADAVAGAHRRALETIRVGAKERRERIVVSSVGGAIPH
jgi:hypothetical protein